MRFYIKKLLLWLNQDELRELEFKANKVNIITGASGTGKSEILSIIDYCFFASKPNITEEKINESIKWYGIQFVINDKCYTIARGKIEERKASRQYYFSPQGSIPQVPVHNMDEKDLKLVIEKEFTITEKTIFPYGGKKISLGSKISFRYFLMFNTQDGDTIDHSEVFFDKQNNDKYREALERIFDLAVGIETEENLTLKEKVISLTQEINKLKRKRTSYENEFENFRENIMQLAKKAKEHNLLDIDETNFENICVQLQNTSYEFKENNLTSSLEKLNNLTQKKNKLIRKIRNFKRYKEELNRFVKIEKETLDSLKPSEQFKEKYYKVLNLPDLDLLITNLEEEYSNIRNNIAGKPPFEFDVNGQIKEYEEQLKKVNEEIESIPLNEKGSKNQIEKLIFIGELRTKMNFFNKQPEDSSERIDDKIESKEELKIELEKQIVDYQEKRESTLRLLDELIQTYLDKSGNVLDIYKGYKSSFNYKEKKLELRAPKSTFVSKVGSSSNHLFLHLCLFLGLHELIIRQDSPYVPQWLVLDQPSRPYFGEEEGKKQKEKKEWKEVGKTDRDKITTAMKLLNDFIKYVNEELERDFQIIVFEHIPTTIWEEANLQYFHLVEEFRDGKALI